MRTAPSRAGLPPVAVSAGMLATAMAVATFPQFLFGAVAPFLLEAYGLTRSALGGLTTVVFGTAVLLSPAMGAASARMGPRAGYSVLLLVPVAAALGFGMSTVYLHLIACAALAGIALALSNPVTNQLIPALVAERWRGLVIGIKQSGVQMGAMVVGVTLPLLVVTVGWRAALFGVAGFMLLAWAGFLPVIPPAYEQDRQAGTGAHHTGSGRSQVLALAGFAFVMGSAMAAVMNYLPLYAFETVGVDERLAGSLLSVLAITGISSRIVIGHLATRASSPVRVLTAIAAVGLAGLVLLLAAPTVSPALLWIGALVFGCNLSWSSVAMLAVVDSRQINTARGSAHVMMGFYAGFILVPPGFGHVVDLTGSYTLPWVALTVLMGVTALVTLLVARRSHASPSA